MQYAISVFLSVISGVLVYVVNNLVKENQQLRTAQKDTEQKREKAIAQGVLSLLRIQLIEYYDKYMTGDNIPTYAYENWDDMYKSYESLGGNGLIKHMKEDIDRLKVGNK